ncbi:MAG: glycosyltransferase family 2 protein [Candidatus Hodarchaeota archaeon]
MSKKIHDLNISFSIIMANYNNGAFIEVAIKSLLSQTYRNWELIIVDDGSTDNSVQIIQSFLNDNRIKLFINKTNYGVGFSKKKGCSYASNDILGILDADDKLEKKALEIIAKEYKENPEYGFIYTNMWNCDSELKNCKQNRKIGSIPNKSSIFNPIIFHFRTFRKVDYIKTSGYDPNLKSAVDKDIIYKLEEVTNFKFINKPLYYYRHHEKGISQYKNEFQARVYHYIAKCKTYKRRLNTNLPNYTLKELYKEYFAITLFKLRKTMKYLLKSIYGFTFLRIILKLLHHSQIHKKIEKILNKLK